MVQNKGIPYILKNPKTWEFIALYANTPTAELVLNLAKKGQKAENEVLEHLNLLNKAQKKLPVFTKKGAFFLKKPFEQSSSEATALYKAQLLNGSLLVNLTGGLGVDDWAFATQFEQIISLDIDQDTHYIAHYNLHKIGVFNVERIHEDAESFQLPKGTDAIYIDPDRRPKEERTPAPEAWQPNFISLWKNWLQQSKKLLIKLSPLTDLTWIDQQFKDSIAEVHVVSAKGEVKELLVLLSVSNNNPTLHISDVIHKEWNRKYPWKPSEINVFSDEFNALVHLYIGIPSAGIRKANRFKEEAKRTHLTTWNGSHLLLSSIEIPTSFAGRRFEFCEDWTSEWKKNLKKLKQTKLHIISHQYILKAEEISKKYQLIPGGAQFLIFCGNHKRQHPQVLLCKQLD